VVGVLFWFKSVAVDALQHRREPNMEITEVKVFPIDEEKLQAFVSVVFDRCFMVNDIKIIHGRDGLFISMPSRKKKNGEFKDVAHPLNNETRRMIEVRVVEEYERVLGERGESLPAPARAHAADDGDAADDAADDGEETGETTVAKAPPSFPEAQTEAPPMAATSGDDAAPAIEEPEVEATAEAEVVAVKEDKGKSLEEVQERHLRDSFWSVS
jgi:stage V sporulation protein G